MTREEFIKILKSKDIDYIDKGNNLIITEKNEDINLSNITSIPCNIEFNNNGHIYLENVTEISENVIFSNNLWNVYLNSLKKITGKIQFNNKWVIRLDNLKYLNKNVILNNKGNIYLDSLKEIENRYTFSKNIKNIHINKLKKFPIRVKFYNIGIIGYLNSNFMNNIKKYRPKGISYKRFLEGYNK